jgi:Ser/Thr protein kinase RdoA (MazF antagonist)
MKLSEIKARLREIAKDPAGDANEVQSLAMLAHLAKRKAAEPAPAPVAAADGMAAVRAEEAAWLRNLPWRSGSPADRVITPWRNREDYPRR